MVGPPPPPPTFNVLEGTDRWSSARFRVSVRIIVIWLGDNFVKPNCSTSKTALFDLRTHFLIDFACVSS